MDVCIFMRDRSGIHCTLEEGHNAEAEDLFDIVLQEQGFPPECEDVFALWLVSPLIGRSVPGGYSHFFLICRLGPSIYPSLQKNIRNFKHSKKYLEF